MLPRSFLFVPADQDRKLERAMECGADALILDLENAVRPAAKARARAAAAAFLDAHSDLGDQVGLGDHVDLGARARLIVRINALGSAEAEDDLNAICPARPDAILLPKALGGTCVIHLDAKLAVREAENGLADGAIGIFALAHERAESLFAAGTFAGASARLRGLSWGVADLMGEIGAHAARGDDGAFLGPFALARHLCLLAAAAAKVQAIDTALDTLHNDAALERECREAWRDGFTGKLAVHPDQVAIINAAMMPSAAQIDQARAIVAAFAAHPQCGALAIDGKMMDAAHLARARRILAASRDDTRPA